MTNKVTFEEVFELFDACGWKLQKISEPYRVFVKKGELPFLIPVNNKQVDT